MKIVFIIQSSQNSSGNVLELCFYKSVIYWLKTKIDRTETTKGMLEF